MANTLISIKKSNTPFSVPATLAHGELALNYADGIIYYKAANGSIASISSGTPSFSTINAAGTLIIADIVDDYLTINAGTNIEISGDALNDSLTITANLKSVFDVANAAFYTANVVSEIADGNLLPANNWANTINAAIQTQFPAVNNYILSVATAGNTWVFNTFATITNATSSFAHANAAFDAANNVGPQIAPAYNTANAAFFNSNAVYDYTNTAIPSLNTYISNVATSSYNYTVSVGDSANNWANTKLANGTGTLAGSLTVTGTVTTGSVIILNSEIDAFTITTSSIADQIIDSFVTTAWRSANYVVTMTAGTDYHTTQVSLIHDGTNAYITEYGTLSTANNLGIFNASVVSGTVRLNVVPRFATTTINMVRTTNK